MDIYNKLPLELQEYIDNYIYINYHKPIQDILIISFNIRNRVYEYSFSLLPLDFQPSGTTNYTNTNISI